MTSPFKFSGDPFTSNAATANPFAPPPPPQNPPSSTSDTKPIKFQEENERKPYPQFNAFRPFVMKELTRRKSTPSSFYVDITPQLTAPFVRMTSCAENGQPGGADYYRFFTLGLHGYAVEDRDIFQTSYGAGKEIVGYGFVPPTDGGTKWERRLINTSQLTPSRLSDTATQEALSPEQLEKVRKDQQDREILTNKSFAHGTHPIPGITDVRITRLGLGTAIQATVQWTCYNQAQLEYCRQHFFNVGNHVVLEWGQNASTVAGRALNVLDFRAPDIVDTLLKSITGGRKYIISNWCNPNHGNYDYMVGSVANFQINMDARTGVYTCTTQIVSVSEQMWGLNNFMTHIPAKRKESAGVDNIRVSTISEFFKVGGLYDSLIRQNQNVSTMVAQQYSRWAAKNNGPDSVSKENSYDYSENFMSNAEDYTFVSWEFLTRIVTTALFHLLDDPSGNIKADLTSFIAFFEGETTGPTLTERPLPIDENYNGPNQTVWVGDNPFLVSTTPDSMIIIRKNNISYAPSPLKGIGTFDGDSQGFGYRGKLSRGIWLNSEMIRQNFLSSNTFGDAFTKILFAMNNATANYWKLRIYWDDEIGRMRIVDEGQTNFPDKTFYKFNVGGQGECLNITFDSAFPPELITQMQLISKFKTESPAEQEELLDKYPLIGTTSTFAFSVNWTNLTDLLNVALEKLRNPPTSDKVNIGVTGATNKNASLTARGAVVGKGNIASKATSPNNPDPGAAIGGGTPATPESKSPSQQEQTKNSNTTGPSSTDSAALREDFNNRLQKLIAIMTKAVASGGGRVEIIQKKITAEAGQAKYEAARTQPGPLQIPNIVPGISYHVDDLSADLVIRNSDGTLDYASANQLAAFYAPRIDPSHTADRGTGDIGGFNLEYIGSEEVGHTGHVQLPRTVILTAGSNSDAIPRSTPDVDATGKPIPNTDANTIDAEKKKGDTIGDYIKKFGNEIILLVNLNPGSMITEITQDGYNDGYKAGHPNSFVSPFPTSTAISVTILGISGLSVSDGFYVDKLPFIFEKYGCFQITTIEESITKEGWQTHIRGYFKLVYIDGYPEKKGASQTYHVTPQLAPGVNDL